VEKLNIFRKELGEVSIIEGMKQYQCFFILADESTILAADTSTAKI
jgi:hypothetical protein